MALFHVIAIVYLCVSMATTETCTDDVCEFTLVVRRARTMVYTGSDGTNGVEILRNGSLQVKIHQIDTKDRNGPIVPVEETITADGVQRNVILVNDQFPGPTLEVMEGAQVVITVTNNMPREATSLHFHGMYMRGVPHMDGVPYITQCPILPMNNFTYRFKAEPSGTHWYHSHMASQKEDGLFGAFIVHKNSMPSTPALPLFLQDWWHEEFTAIDADSWYMPPGGPGRYYDTIFDRGYSFDGCELTAVRYLSALINGRGRYDNNNAPLTRFIVQSGQTLRFRLVHAGAEFTFRVSIDAHSMTVVANDGHDIEPVQVQSIIVCPGESYDFQVDGTQLGGLYWIRAETLWSGRGKNLEPDDRVQEVRAILAYDGASTAADPSSSKPSCTEERPCQVLNCPFPAFPAGSHTNCLHISDVNSTDEYVQPDESDIVEYFFNFGFQVGASVNSRRFVPPKKPLVFGKPYDVTPCEATCETEGCRCTYVVEIPSEKTVRFVMSNSFAADSMHHAIHFHGHDFRVLAMGFPYYNKTTGHWISQTTDIKCANDKCTMPSWNGTRPTLNFNKPPVRDTVVVPARGYTVIEFRSNNPGYWYIHCHQTTHLNEGMSMVIAQAPDKLPALPYGFPTCGDFTGTERPTRGDSSENTEVTTRSQSGFVIELDHIKLVIIITMTAALSSTVALSAVGLYISHTNKNKGKMIEASMGPQLVETTVPNEDAAPAVQEDAI